MGIMGLGILGTPLGFVMRFIFDIVQNYGLALLIFTVLTRVILIPLTIKQTKSSSKIAMVQPQLAEITKKYAGNRHKINEETMALYQKVGYNPASGCLPMALQMIILFGVIDVIFRPLTHILAIPRDVIARANEITQGLADTGGGLGMRANAIELATLNQISYNAENYVGYIPYEYITAIQNFLPQMNFLGINLMEVPSVNMIWQVFSSFNPVILIPLFAGITSVLLSLATLKYTATPQGGPNMKAMMMIMPLFSVFFTFQMPAGIGIYWIYTNTVGFAQSRIMGHFYNPKDIAEKAKKEMEEEKERERLERIEAKKKAKERGESEEKETLSKKEQNRRKLAEARKRDAEKYGEQYEESADTED